MAVTELDQNHPKRTRGDVRHDGFIFWGYANYFRKDGAVTRMEKWIRPESYNRAMVAGERWRLANKEKLKRYGQGYERKRRANDPMFRLLKTTRSRISGLLAGKKSAKSLELIGCTADALRSHLQSQFETGMTWDNFGSFWHADHIIPLAWFDLNDPNQQKWAFHYSNLQPLTKADNLRKNDKIAWRGCTAT